MDSLVNGAIHWDVTLSKTLAVVMVAALTSRAGDVTKNRMDEQKLPYLCYDDVTLKLVGGDDLENLMAKITIRGEKCFK